MERERPGGRAGRWILGDSVCGDEAARLPALAVAGEAVGAVGAELEQRADVGPQRRHRVRRSRARPGRGPGPAGRARPAARSSRLPSRASSSSALARTAPPTNGGCRIQPKATREPSRSSRTGTTPAPVSSQSSSSWSGPREHERRPEHRMPGERKLERRREDADPGVPVARGRVDEDGLGEVDLARQRLEPFLGDLARVGEDGELVAGERNVGEDVGDDVAERGHDARLYRRVPSTLPRGCTRSRSAACARPTGTSRRSGGSTSRSRRGRSSDSSGRTERARRRPSRSSRATASATPGEVRVLGSDPERPAPDFRERIGVVLQQSRALAESHRPRDPRDLRRLLPARRATSTR